MTTPTAAIIEVEDDLKNSNQQDVSEPANATYELSSPS